MRGELVALGVAVFCAAGCEGQAAPVPEVSREHPVIPVDSGIVRIESGGSVFRINVEIAETREQQSTGLMERRALAADEGMLFLYAEEQADSDSFYMFRTRIPLAIAFADSTGQIVATREMEPCPHPVADWCEQYAPGSSYRSALEVNGGYFDSKGIGVGDRIVLEKRFGQ